MPDDAHLHPPLLGSAECSLDPTAPRRSSTAAQLSVAASEISQALASNEFRRIAGVVPAVERADDAAGSTDGSQATRHAHHVVRLAGELDLLTVGEFNAQLQLALESGALRVTLDLRELAFCDVTGLNVILGAHRTLAERGGGLMIHDPPSSMKIMLRVLGTPPGLAIRYPVRH
jgi:anti-sigma B factor antagonist